MTAGGMEDVLDMWALGTLDIGLLHHHISAGCEIHALPEEITLRQEGPQALRLSIGSLIMIGLYVHSVRVVKGTGNMVRENHGCALSAVVQSELTGIDRAWSSCAVVSRAIEDEIKPGAWVEELGNGNRRVLELSPCIISIPVTLALLADLEVLNSSRIFRVDALRGCPRLRWDAWDPQDAMAGAHVSRDHDCFTETLDGGRTLTRFVDPRPPMRVTLLEGGLVVRDDDDRVGLRGEPDIDLGKSGQVQIVQPAVDLLPIS